MTLLSDVDIRRHMDYGSVVIAPFRDERLNTDSYDLELGPWFWRYQRLLNRRPADLRRGAGFELVNAADSGGLWLDPDERVLGHSVEVAGGRLGFRPRFPNQFADGRVEAVAPEAVAVTTHLQATSTAARHGLSACMCAGWGDVGFVSVWVFEITNHTRDRLWLPVGALIAQIAFSEVTPPSAVYGEITGQYQHAPAHLDADAIRGAWRPEHMLPGPLKVRETWKEVAW